MYFAARIYNNHDLMIVLLYSAIGLKLKIAEEA